MKIGAYISELLYTHDAVILPGFGEFFTKYTPAKFIPEEAKVLSPSKTVAFKTETFSKETPLADHICKKHDMEVGQVYEYLQNFVNEVMQLLHSGRKVELEKLGIFSKDAAGEIFFEPDVSINYLNVPAGEVPEPPRRTYAEWPPAIAATLPVPPVPPPAPPPAPPSKQAAAPPPFTPAARRAADREVSTYAEQTPKETKEREIIIMESEKKPVLPIAVKWLAFVAVPVLIILVILALNSHYFLGWFTKGTDPVIVTTTEQPASQPASVDPTPGIIGAGGETGVDTPIQEQVSPGTGYVAAQPPPQPARGQKIYYIVVGSFPEEAKAESLAQRLRNQGATMANVFMVTGFNYHRVCYGYYYDLAEAERALPRVKETITSDAYILHR